MISQKLKDKIKNTYKTISYAFFGLFILLVVLNFTAYMFYKVRYSKVVKALKPYLKKDKAKKLVKAYEGAYSLEQIYQIVDEGHKAAHYRYDPWTLFKEVSVKGKYINVTEEGYRLNSEEQKNNAGELKVFMFGGSTMFGYGVADNHTIPAFLEKELPGSIVTNYGRAYYYSTQEMQLFMKLLKSGDIPNAAVFMDGLNDVRVITRWGDKPAHSEIVEAIFSKGYYLAPTTISLLLLTNPMREKIRSFLSKRRQTPGSRNKRSIEEIRDEVISVCAQNRELIRHIAEIYNVKVYFFWQPIPQYAYKMENHVFKTTEHDPAHRRYKVYRSVYSHMKKNPPKDVINLADIFEGKDIVYIDMHHYNVSGCRMIAKEIAKAIKR